MTKRMEDFKDADDLHSWLATEAPEELRNFIYTNCPAPFGVKGFLELWRNLAILDDMDIIVHHALIALGMQAKEAMERVEVE